MVDIGKVERDIERLVTLAIEAATSLEELVDVAHAAAAVGTLALVEAVAAKIEDQVEQALSSSGAWTAELTYSKIDAWAQTGHRAQLLAEAWGAIAPVLRDAATSRARRGR